MLSALFICCEHYVLRLLYKMAFFPSVVRRILSLQLSSFSSPNILQNEFLLKCHPHSEYCMKAERFGVRTPQTKYLGAVLTVSLISSIPAALWWFGRAASVQRAHKHSTIFTACSGIDLRFVCCHLPFSSSVFLLSGCRRRGTILNISSASGMYPVPLLTIYSASKVIAIQSIWPFPHLLNWNLTIRDTPGAAVQSRSVCCWFFPGIWSPCLPPALPECGHVSDAPARAPTAGTSSMALGLFCSNDVLRVLRHPAGGDRLASLLSSIRGSPGWPLASLPLGRSCGCPLETWPQTPGLLLWHVFAPPIIFWQRRSGRLTAFSDTRARTRKS